MAKQTNQTKYSVQNILNLIFDDVTNTIDSTGGAIADVWDSVNHWLKTSLATLLAGEDLVNNVFGIITKPFIGSSYTLTTFISAATVTANIKASQGNLYSFQAVNNNAAARYIQFFDTATTPAGSATAKLSFYIPANSQKEITKTMLGDNGDNFVNGIAYGFSTAATIYTAATNTDHFITGKFL